jgi:Heparinase II/III-like protein/Heparinase II/III N-terminus
MRRLRRPFLAAVVLCLGASGCGQQGDKIDQGQVSALMRQPCPGRLPVTSSTNASAKGLQASRQDRFKILGKRVELRPPVDWQELDPYESDTWRSKLQGWGWIGPLVTRMYHGDAVAVRQGRDLVLDWVRANPPEDGDGWKNKVSGTRAAYFAYITRAAACRRALSDSQATTLLKSLDDHGGFLAKKKQAKRGNHGLFAAEGLLVLSGYASFLPDAPDWHELASKRVARGLSWQIQPREAVDLEHSPGYHFLAIDLVDQLLRIPGQRSGYLVALDRRMRAVAPWFVMPDGYVTRLGDTVRKPAPDWARREAPEYRGLSPTRRSGFAIVKQPGAFLSVAAGYHSGAVHKQADELTFELWDRGRPIVTDTGRYGAARKQGGAKEPAVAFTKSAAAHSVLLVDGRNFDFEGQRPYGSAISATGEGAGWYAIEGSNPLLRPQGVKHRRLFLYRPGVALVVVDAVSSRARHTYTRQFQFDPGLRVQRAGASFRLLAPGLRGWLTQAPGSGELAPTLVRGQRDPLLGWTTSENKFVPFIPRFVARYPAWARSTRYVAVIGLRGRATAGLVATSARATVVSFREPGRPALRLTVTRRGDRLAVSQSAAAR